MAWRNDMKTNINEMMTLMKRNDIIGKANNIPLPDYIPVAVLTDWPWFTVSGDCWSPRFIWWFDLIIPIVDWWCWYVDDVKYWQWK